MNGWARNGHLQSNRYLPRLLGNKNKVNQRTPVSDTGATGQRVAAGICDGSCRIDVEWLAEMPIQGDAQLLALDEALEGLSRQDDRQARIVEMKFFGGLTAPEFAEVESLLSAELGSGDSFLDSPLMVEPSTTLEGIRSPETLVESQPFEHRFELVRRLGEGGMGQVWLADQISPERQPVALKLIRAGMYDETILRRFQAEGQSLAMMEHPAIAKVFDAGATPPWVNRTSSCSMCPGSRSPSIAISTNSASRSASSSSSGCARGPARASEGHHPSGSGAAQHPGNGGRPSAAAQPAGHDRCV